MSPRQNHPFRKRPKSPFDENGPNHAALRRSLEWLQTHDPDTPSRDVTEDVPRQPEKTPLQTKEELASQALPPNEPPPETQPDPIETAERETPETSTSEIETAQPEIAELEAPQPDPLKAQTSQSEPEQTETEQIPAGQSEASQTEATEPESTQAEISDTELDEEERVAAAAAGATSTSYRSDLLDARRFPKHYPADPADPSRHRRLCSICHHEDRDAIEEAFLQWRRPGDIRLEFGLSSRMILYRHAHALGLFEQRAHSVRHVLEKVMEESTTCPPTPDSMIRAVRAYSCLDERGRWIEPPRRLIISREPYRGPELPASHEKDAITVEASEVGER